MSECLPAWDDALRVAMGVSALGLRTGHLWATGGTPKHSPYLLHPYALRGPYRGVSGPSRGTAGRIVNRLSSLLRAWAGGGIPKQKFSPREGGEEHLAQGGWLNAKLY